ncbi:hypothetical protein DE4587_02222 [Mycobacteroides salmoniphilum]|nr:hypothetical protein DE4586_02918 [Mycobacteroides salmoniphilum]TDZ86835.1 hypothetical protein DE4587_02222 [Mycobacteroides salmoniphilum]
MIETISKEPDAGDSSYVLELESILVVNSKGKDVVRPDRDVGH